MKSALAGAYMTGILPIKKYGTESALTDFEEYTMTSPDMLSEYVGFTEEEIRDLCREHTVDFEEMKRWYDGYSFEEPGSVYSPDSVMSAVKRKRFRNYWTGSETYESLKKYISMNFDGLKDSVIAMLGGDKIKIETARFQNDITSFKSKDDVLTLLIHLGYLAYNEAAGQVYIPNLEIAGAFQNAVEGDGWEEIASALASSEELLKATINRNCVAVETALEHIHDLNVSVLQYDDENSLSCAVTLAYYTARNDYTIIRELPSGKGFADLAGRTDQRHNLVGLRGKIRIPQHLIVLHIGEIHVRHPHLKAETRSLRHLLRLLRDMLFPRKLDQLPDPMRGDGAVKHARYDINHGIKLHRQTEALCQKQRHRSICNRAGPQPEQAVTERHNGDDHTKGRHADIRFYGEQIVVQIILFIFLLPPAESPAVMPRHAEGFDRIHIVKRLRLKPHHAAVDLQHTFTVLLILPHQKAAGDQQKRRRRQRDPGHGRIIIKNHAECRDKIIDGDNDIREPADRVGRDRADIVVEPVQQVAVCKSAQLQPVRVDDLVKHFGLDIVVYMNADSGRDTVDQAGKHQAGHHAADHHERQEPEPAEVKPGNVSIMYLLATEDTRLSVELQTPRMV